MRCVAVFPRTGATNRAFLRSLLSHCAVSIRVQACVVCSANFTGIKNGRFSLATCLCEILFRIRENALETFEMLKQLGEM